MATKSTKSSKTSTVKAKPDTTTAPKVSRARKVDGPDGEPLTASDSVPMRASPGRDEIAMRAFERFCARGHQHGHDVEDWLAAERELA